MRAAVGTSAFFSMSLERVFRPGCSGEARAMRLDRGTEWSAGARRRVSSCIGGVWEVEKREGKKKNVLRDEWKEEEEEEWRKKRLGVVGEVQKR